jgi:hypothetical protein
MARRTVDKRTGEQVEQLPLPLAETARPKRNRVRVFAGFFLLLAGVAMAWFLFVWNPPKRETAKPPAVSKSAPVETSPKASLPPAPQPLTFDALVALSPEQQTVEIDQIMRFGFDVGDVAARTLQPELYREVMTGDLLAYRLGKGLDELRRMRAEGRGTDGPPKQFKVKDAYLDKQHRILAVVADVTETWWYVDLATGQRIGDVKHASGLQTYNFREEGGRWRVFSVVDEEQ